MINALPPIHIGITDHLVYTSNTGNYICGVFMLEFKSFGLEDKPAFDTLAAQQGQIENSELSFANLFIWRTTDRIEICPTPGMVLIRCANQHLQPLLEPGASARAAVDAALDDMDARGLQPRIVGVNDQFLHRLRSESGLRGLQIAEDRDMFEYIYKAQSLATLKGRRLHAKRNHINRFNAQYQWRAEPLSSAHLADCLAIYDQWSQGEPPASAAGERLAVEQAIANLEGLGLFGLVVYVGDEPSAFTVAEHLSPRMGLVHLEKAVPAIPELFSVINQLCAQRFFAEAQFINREEDMGIPGLRRAKQSYYPACMIRKHIIRRQP